MEEETGGRERPPWWLSVSMLIAVYIVAQIAWAIGRPDSTQAVAMALTSDRAIVSIQRDTAEVVSPVNLRQGPGTDAPVLTTLAVDTIVEVTGQPTAATGYTWFPVRAGTQFGWVVAQDGEAATLRWQ